MKTDSLFYSLFQHLPGLIFELSGWQVQRPQDYRFQSVELKQTAFRLDGLFTPPEGDENSPLLFAEVQFQPDEGLYGRLFAELFLYLRQFHPKNPWRVVVIYPNQATEQTDARHYQGLLQLPEVQRIYLDKLPDCPQDSLGLRLVRLIVQDAVKAIATAKDLAGRIKPGHPDSADTADLLGLIETILIYKFPRLSREEIQKMLDFTYSDLKQTRFYQDVLGEGKQEGRKEGRQEEAQALVLRLLPRRIGLLSSNQNRRVHTLSLEQIEALAEALLDFTHAEDFEQWLASQSNSSDFEPKR